MKTNIDILKSSTAFMPEFNSNPKNRNRTRRTGMTEAATVSHSTNTDEVFEQTHHIPETRLSKKCSACEKKRKIAVETPEKESKKAKRRSHLLDTHCAICLGDVDEGKFIALDCSHVFHEKCMQAWLSKYKLKTYPLCPTCREIVVYQVIIR